MTTTHKGAAGRQSLIDAADGLLRTVGYTGASIGRILQASGAPRGSIYHYFPNGKAEIVAAALEQFDRYFRGLVEAAMSRPVPLEEKVERFVHGMVKELQKRNFQSSCVVSVVLLELGDQDDTAAALHALCARILTGWADLIASNINEFGPVERRGLATKMVAALEGAWILARAHRSAEPLLQAKQLLVDHIRMLQQDALPQPGHSGRRASTAT